MILYQEYPPHPALSALVECMWTCRIRPDIGPHMHRVLPDNCIDILWQDLNARHFAVGMMTGADVVVTEAEVRTVAVRFKAGGAAYFFGIPLHALTNAKVDIGDLLGRDLADRIDDALWADDLTDRERLDVLESQLIAFLSTRGNPTYSGLVDRAVAAIVSSNGQLRIDTLAGAAGVSRQYLAAQFRERVGISAKLFARIDRFQCVVDDIRRAPSAVSYRIDWAQLAADKGYFDQSHLIRDFSQFAGCAPAAFVSEMRR